ncbi:MAG: hypothetical protein MZU95_04730 [Desulfomicrobium escambiense]|nr:hypothetical protein [Desulfomicrobium escambiense]
MLFFHLLKAPDPARPPRPGPDRGVQDVPRRHGDRPPAAPLSCRTAPPSSTRSSCPTPSHSASSSSGPTSSPTCSPPRRGRTAAATGPAGTPARAGAASRIGGFASLGRQRAERRHLVVLDGAGLALGRRGRRLVRRRWRRWRRRGLAELPRPVPSNESPGRERLHPPPQPHGELALQGVR